MPRVTVRVKSPAQMFLGYNSKRAQDVPGCGLEKIRRLNKNMLAGIILKLINEDEELLREEVRLPPDQHGIQDAARGRANVIGNELGGRPVHLSGSCQDASHFARKEDSTYV